MTDLQHLAFALLGVFVFAVVLTFADSLVARWQSGGWRR